MGSETNGKGCFLNFFIDINVPYLCFGQNLDWTPMLID